MGAVLIVDDSRVMRAQTAAALAELRMEVVTHEAADPVEALRVLLSRPIDLVLCDLEMPRGGGHLLLRMVRDREDLVHVPVIMVTANDDASVRLTCLQLGAADYVARPFAPAELVARVGVHLRAKLLRDQLEQKNRELEALSRLDPLTELANRRALMDGLSSELRRSERYARPMSLCMVDIDHFKAVNDTYGHAVGDRVLRLLAQTLTSHVRTTDLVGRYGGEEFLVVLAETDLRGAHVLAERLRQAVCALEVDVDVRGTRVRITASFGVAERDVRGEGIEAVLRRADRALYAAKNGGRNRVVSLHDDPTPDSRVA